MTNVRQWLGRARGIDREIEALLRDIQETRDRLTKITQSYSSDGAQSTKDPHKFDKLVGLESQVNRRIDDLLEAKKEIAEAIQSSTTPPQRTVLYSYYVRCKTMEQIAVETRYSYAHVKRLRAKGILEFEKNFSDFEKMSHNEP